MRLDENMVLIGRPEKGDRLGVTLKDSRRLKFTYEPHGWWFDHYLWRAEPMKSFAEIEALYAKLPPRNIKAEWMECYLDKGSQIAIGQILSVALVPNGQLPNWPRATLSSTLASIVIL